MIENLNTLARSKTYWLVLVLLGIALLVVALIYQYAWGEAPCLLCIHVRLWVAGATLLAAIAIFVPRQRLLLAAFHALYTVMMVGIFERAWLLLGTERGTLIASCEFDLGLPSWLAFDKWLPTLFEVQAACGYTPNLLFGITMAEGLIILSAALALLSATLMMVLLLRKSR